MAFLLLCQSVKESQKEQNKKGKNDWVGHLSNVTPSKDIQRLVEDYVGNISFVPDPLCPKEKLRVVCGTKWEIGVALALEATLSDLRKAIYNEEEIPHDRQLFFFHGKILQDENISLGELAILPSARIYLFLMKF